MSDDIKKQLGAVIDSYKEDSIAAIVCLVLGSFAVLGGLYVGITACLG